MMKKSIFILASLAIACTCPLHARPQEQTPDAQPVKAEEVTALLASSDEAVGQLRELLTQKTVGGVVRNEETQLPVAGAKVTVGNGKQEAVTSEDGAFTLVLPYEQQTVSLSVEAENLSKLTGEFDVEDLTLLMSSSWNWSEVLWIALISICLVFFVLVLLVWIMKVFGYVFVRRQPSVSAGRPEVVQGQLHEEEIAAIATAIRLFRGEQHDRESEVLTIMSIKRAYSPWNSKIHGLTQLPDRK